VLYVILADNFLLIKRKSIFIAEANCSAYVSKQSYAARFK